MKYLASGLAVLAVIMTPAWAATEVLVDPTLPPKSLAAAVDDKSAGKVESAPVLQSVLMAPGRKFATINGQTLRVGEKYGDATLIKVSDQDAVLRNADGSLQVLKMQPAVDKSVSQSLPQEMNTHKTKRPVQAAAPDIR